MTVTRGERRGWTTLAIRTPEAEAVLVPGKGGDVLSFSATDGPNVLWTSPWGLRERGVPTAASDSEGRLMEAYPGGWQTVFPNAGDATATQNTTWGMHGEVWLTPFDVVEVGDCAVDLLADLVHSPFRITKHIELEGRRLTVTQTVVNTGGDAVEVMSGHHPAVGTPVLGDDTVLDTGARTIVVDGDDQGPAGDLLPGGTADWPHAPGLAGSPVDLRALPGHDEPRARMAYLTDFTKGWVTVRNPRIGVRIEWDATVLPYAWYWLEAHGTSGFPWYRRAYVLGVEPATSIPGHGLDAARTAGTSVTIAPGDGLTTAVSMTLLGPS